jgi:hypothetical protein
MIILGIAGRARRGKDTVAKYLHEVHGFQQLAFADPLRDMLQAGLGIETRYCTDEKEAVIPGIGASYRELMQTLGTEWGRVLIHPDIWIHRLERALVHADPEERIVISDVRFGNEADWVRRRGHLIHLDRPADNGVRPHVSELGVPPLENEPVFHNTGSLADLFHQIDTWLDHAGILNPNHIA